MRSWDWDDIHARVPVNAITARVVGRGIDYVPEKPTDIGESDLPIKTTVVNPVLSCNPDFKDLTGAKFGRFTVVGILDTEASDSKKVKWVCKCFCGRHATRSSRAVRNPKNSGDMCSFCQDLERLKKNDFKKRTGLYPDELKT